MLMAIVACILAGGIFAAGNRMPLVLFIFGFIIILFFNINVKKVVLFCLTSVLNQVVFFTHFFGEFFTKHKR